METTKKKKITELTTEQEAHQVVVRDKWLKLAMGGVDYVDEPAVKRGLDFLYGLPPLCSKGPEVFTVVDSPHAAQELLHKIDPKANYANEGGWWYQGLGPGSAYAAWCDFWYSTGLLAQMCEDDPTLNDLVPQTEQLLAWMQAGVWDCLLDTTRAVIIRLPCRVVKEVNQERVPAGAAVDIVRSDRGDIIAAFTGTSEVSRLHNPNGPAIEWRDGYAAYSLHGVWIPKGRPDLYAMIDNHEKLDARVILKERNVEVRRVLAELMGERYYAQLADIAEVLDTDTDLAGQPRRLLKITQPEEEDLVICHVVCPSTGHNHWLRVPPTQSNCAEAIAWTFDETPKTYHPVEET